nr:hypothetical protein [Tanacetum cinerariifolium]
NGIAWDCQAGCCGGRGNKPNGECFVAAGSEERGWEVAALVVLEEAKDVPKSSKREVQDVEKIEVSKTVAIEVLEADKVKARQRHWLNDMRMRQMMKRKSFGLKAKRQEKSSKSTTSKSLPTPKSKGTTSKSLSTPKSEEKGAKSTTSMSPSLLTLKIPQTPKKFAVKSLVPI